MDSPINILLIEDTPIDAELAARVLQKAGIAHRMVRVDTETAFLHQLETATPDVIVSDYSMPHFDGLSALALARERAPHIPFIFLSGTMGEEVAIETLKRGALDYVLKSNLVRIGSAVQRAIQESTARAVTRRAEQDLRAAQERFALFMQHLPGPAYIKGLDGRFHFANMSFQALTGLPSAALIGKTIGDLWPDKAELHAFNDEWVRANNQVLQTVETLPHRDGDHSYLVHKFPIPGDNGSPVLIGGIAIDFTDRLLADQKVARLSRIHALLSGINSTIVRARTKESLLHEACRIAEDEGGFKIVWIGMVDNEKMSPRSLSCTSAREVTDTDGNLARARLRLVDEVLQRDTYVVTSDPAIIASIDSPPRDEGKAITSIAALPLRINSRAVGAFVLGAGEAHIFDNDELRLLRELAGDISFALEYLEKKSLLDYLAFYDSLTGLPNRTLCGDRVNQVIRSHAPGQPGAAMIALDIERFSLVNDSFGRQCGDTLLKQVADRLRDMFSGAATVARLGANTFGIVLTDIDEGTAAARMLEEAMARQLSFPFTIEGEELRLAFKSGIALFPADGTDAEVLIHNAETALKSAKASGVRYLFYAASMNGKIAEILRIENRLRTALAKNQFSLLYQPKMDMASGAVDGVEALLRWNDPETGLVAPAVFIETLEKTGMILEVGLWVLREAVGARRAWQAAGHTAPRVAVNVSSLQLRQASFVEDVLGAIADAGGAPIDVDLEITESVIMENISQYIPKLQTLREAGIGVAIDDFGTGYSSLAYISQLPATVLKIDRSFITAMSDGKEGMTIVSTIISLAHLLNLGVIAEGVETKEQLDRLRQLRCDTVQGYFFSRPITCDGIERMLARASAENKAHHQLFSATPTSRAGAAAMAPLVD